MKRTAVCFALLIALNSCQLPAERMPIRQLPEDSPPLPYPELLTRARLQSSAATEAFYVNQWADLEEHARGLTQTARFMNKATEVPEVRKKTLVTDADELSKTAAKLTSAAKAKDEKQANQALQQINLLVRKLRPEDPPEKPKDK
jgi:hypothetical protein